MNASNASPATDADHAVVLPPTRAFDSVEAGEHLPDLAIPLDRSLIVATAIASRDFQPVHHDPS
ncbi:MAG TPA: hypothetical protein PKV27_05945, partial [Ilumatobacteraceae bacterium]|nr:hypothetical protein [Ilumatobacteraceae bacterium]